MTNAQRLGWVTLAATLSWTNALGQAYPPTGQQLFTYCQSNLLFASLPLQLTAPTAPPSLPLITTMDTYYSSTSVWGFDVATTGGLDTAYLVLYAASPQQNGLTAYRQNLFRYMYATNGTLTAINIAPSYVATFGVNVEGVFVGAGKMLDSATGFTGALVYTALEAL